MSTLPFDRLAMITRLAALPAPSGDERLVAVAIREILQQSGLDVHTDALGSLSATIPGRDAGATVLLLAHMDEVGLRVRTVQPDGTLRFDIFGWIDPAILPGTRVHVLSEREPLAGVVAARSAHLSLLPGGVAGGPPPLWIDVGAASASQARAMGVTVGAGVVFDSPVCRLGEGHLTGKALDNRVGCALLLEVAAWLANNQPAVTVHLGFSTQEEVGAHGARVLARRLAPTICLIVDTVSAADTLTGPPLATVVVGGGPVLRVADALPRAGGPTLVSTTYARQVRRSLEEVAHGNALPYQTDIATTWTDAAGAVTAGDGLAVQGLYLPRRGSHTPQEVMALQDIEVAATLLRAWLALLDGPSVQALRVPW